MNFFSKTKTTDSLIRRVQASREERKVLVDDERDTQFKYTCFALYMIATCVV
jgi:hypothetical protein